MKKSILFVMIIYILVNINNLFAQQNDTSSYFPLGLWGIWIDQSRPPYVGAINWGSESQKWIDIKGNYLVFFTPDWLESQLMDTCESIGYKMNISRRKYNYTQNSEFGTDTSLEYWIKDGYPYYDSYWRGVADGKIQRTYNEFGSHQALYSYSLGHEYPIINYTGYGNYYPDSNRIKSVFWPRLEYVCSKFKNIDNNPNHKSYAAGSVEYGFTNAVTSLDVLQYDRYPFSSNTTKTYTSQQNALDILVSKYNTDISEKLVGTNIEWQVVIQAQREYVGDNIARRPTFYEQRVMAYLALSRGARGVTAYVYGSRYIVSPLKDQSIQAAGGPNDLLIAGRSITSVDHIDGIVDLDRDKYTQLNDQDNIPVFNNVRDLYLELAPIGPTIRKLKHFDHFPNTNIPTNSANICSVSGDKIEVGTFRRMDQGTNGDNYFIVVNRVLNDANGNLTSPQNITIEVSGGKYFTRDQKTNNIDLGSYNSGTNRTSFSISLSPGEGKLFLVKMKKEGTISSNTTWQDLEVVYDNITVNSGVSLSITSGTKIMYASSKGMTINGTLNATGTSANPITFTSDNSSNRWSGIVINGSGAGSSVLSHCVINNVQTTGGSVVSLVNVSGNPIIEYTKIQNCVNYSTSAIVVSNTNGYITRNLLDNNYIGVNCTNYGSPTLGRYSDNSCSNGNNTITNNSYGVYAYNSSPYMGSDGNTSVEYNGIYSNTSYNLYATGSSYIDAENDYWGSGTPSGILAVNGASITYSPYLTCCPTTVFKINQQGSGSAIPISRTNNIQSDLNSLLKQARENQFNKKYADAVGIYKSIITTSPDSKESLIALSGLLSVYRDNSDPEILKYIDNLPKKDGDFDAVSRMVLANGYVIANKPDNALSIFQNISQKYKQTDYEKCSLIQTAIINFFNKKDEITTNVVLTNLDSKYKGDKDVDFVKWLINGRGTNNQNNFAIGTNNDPAKIQNDSVNVKKTLSTNEGDLIQNYPNPFNPTTTITYNIPIDGQVKLVIYDVLGKEVRNLVNEVKQAGQYTIQFDGSRLASGIYYCRLTISPSNGEKSMIQQRRMQLLK